MARQLNGKAQKTERRLRVVERVENMNFNFATRVRLTFVRLSFPAQFMDSDLCNLWVFQQTLQKLRREHFASLRRLKNESRRSFRPKIASSTGDLSHNFMWGTKGFFAFGLCSEMVEIMKRTLDSSGNCSQHQKEFCDCRTGNSSYWQTALARWNTIKRPREKHSGLAIWNNDKAGEISVLHIQHRNHQINIKRQN